MEERKKLERDLSDARKKLAMGGGATNGGAAAGGVREAGGVKLLARAVEGVETKDLKSLVDDGKKQIGSGVVAIVGVTEDGKAGIVVGVTSRSHLALQRGRTGAQGLRSAWRQGRRRPARHGAGRRARRRQGECRAVGDRTGDGRRLGGHRSGQTRDQRPGLAGPALRTARTRSSAAFGRLALCRVDRRHHRPRRAGDDPGLGAGIRRHAGLAVHHH